jgi:hypothetical protein
MTADTRRYRAGDRVDDLCRACKTSREHAVVAADVMGRPARVVCNYCGSQHNFRGGAASLRKSSGQPRAARGLAGGGEPFPLVSERERSLNPMSYDESAGGGAEDLETMLRRVIREETGLTAVVPADKWRGGDVVLKPGREGVKEVSWPIEKFFHKVVMLRNRLRVLEQQINGADLPDDLKVKLQGYITGCYGTLTSFNVLFADDDDRFQGASK